MGKDSNEDNSFNQDVLKSIKLAVMEIEEVLNQSLDSMSIPELVDFIKKHFYQVFLNNRSEFDETAELQRDDNPHILNVKDSKGFDEIRGKLDFQHVMDDISKNYEWLKEKSLKTIGSLEENYDQIARELNELNQRISTYSIHDNVYFKNQRSTSSKISQMKDPEKKIMLNTLDDIFGLVKYTDESVGAAIQISFEDIETLKETIMQYHELIEDKIRSLPRIISNANLKAGDKSEREGMFDELYVPEAEKSDRTQSHKQDADSDGKL